MNSENYYYWNYKILITPILKNVDENMFGLLDIKYIFILGDKATQWNITLLLGKQENRSYGKEIPHFSWNMWNHYRFHDNPQLDSVPNQLNSVCVLTQSLFDIPFQYYPSVYA